MSVGCFICIGRMKVEQTEHSKMSAHKILMLRNHPQERIPHSKDGKKFVILLTRLRLVCSISLFSLHFNPNAFLSVVLFVILTCQKLKIVHFIYIFFFAQFVFHFCKK
jgi:hypothetical protein